jgi:hypothetical protein
VDPLLFGCERLYFSGFSFLHFSNSLQLAIRWPGSLQ